MRKISPNIKHNKNTRQFQRKLGERSYESEYVIKKKNMMLEKINNKGMLYQQLKNKEKKGKAIAGWIKVLELFEKEMLKNKKHHL